MTRTMGFIPPTPATTPSARDVPATEGCRRALDLLRQWPGEHHVAVGLSGGVDSSLTAALLQEARWSVTGVTLWLMKGRGACCSDGLVDAAGVCEQLGVPHHVLDARDTFQQEVVDPLVEGYGQGITPLPCSRCNRHVKMALLLQWAEREMGISRLATGHYARLRRHPDSGRMELLRGRDRQKDQSYFLYDLPQEQLERLVFPLGELKKAETRTEAQRHGLRTATKPESQDLCLVEHHGSMAAFLETHLPPRPGTIVLRDGTVVGSHDGVQHFTIGQRRGLGVAWPEPLHVVRLDGPMNQVVVAPRSEAVCRDCAVAAVNWVSIPPPAAPLDVQVQVRYRSEPVTARLLPDGASQARLRFETPQFSVTPGQAAVFYAEEVLLGGGLIQREMD